MEQLIVIFVLLPLVGFLITLIIPKDKEKLLSGTAFFITGSTMFAIFTFIIWWLVQGMPSYNVKEVVLYQAADYSFFIDLYFDKITAVYLGFSSVLAYLIAIYSRYYLHREEGYKRFFNTNLLFITGVNLIVLAGNFETLFVGWEILGVSSFLLIGYYRERYLPVKNALKVYSIYRIADIGLLLAMWLSHHLWHANITFLQLSDANSVHEHLHDHSATGLVISMAIVLAAAAKSAQFPFSSWLPRAMEGPTPSSAIFYGSVAVHIGVFLLLRTFPFWDEQWGIRVFVILLGLITTILAAIAGKAQTSVKAQIAYSSITQIGIIFIEVALGLDWLALIHLTGNAFLRAYQLLISPSAVTYLIREQFFHLKPTKKPKKASRFAVTLFVIGLKEWNLDELMYKVLWLPLKKIGKRFGFINIRNVSVFSLIVFAASSVFIPGDIALPEQLSRVLPEIYGAVAVILVLVALAERKNVFLAWELVVLSHFWIAFAVGFNESFDLTDTLFYLSGVVVAGLAGYILLHRLKKKKGDLDLNGFYGHVREHKWLAFYFLLSCLALAGFPITTTFLGEDLLFTHIHENQLILAFLVSVNFIIEGLALMRMYTRIFLGPNKKAYHGVPLRGA